MSNSIPGKLIQYTPAEYAEAAILAREAGEEMLRRLEWVTLQPKVILDAGCGTGYFSGLLQQRYPDARVLAMDVAYPMLEFLRQQDAAPTLICADAEIIPLKNQSVDLIFANLVLPWCDSAEKLMREWRRVLRPEGLLVFTGLGPDTLAIWRDTFSNSALPEFADMHNLGDILTRVKWMGAVMDADYFTLEYASADDLIRELKASGMLLQAENFSSPHEEKRNPDGFFPAVYEVIFGHAWRPPVTADLTANEEGVVKFPLAHLRGRR